MDMAKRQQLSAMHRVTWCKNFVSGPLTGLQVRCSITVDSQRCAEVQAGLSDHTPDNPGEDCLTGTQYWCSGVGCEEIATEMPSTTLPKLADGRLESYAWPGGYPIYYLDGESSVLCPGCAQHSLEDSIPHFQPQAFGVLYEAESLLCDQCSKEINDRFDAGKG